MVALLPLSILFIFRSATCFSSRTSRQQSPNRVRPSFVHCMADPQNNGKDTVKHIVLVGGGHAHVQVIKALHQRARGENVRITLIDPLESACYSGMVPGCIVGSYEPSETLINLRSLAKWASAEFVHDSVVDVDFDEKCVHISNVPDPIFFDVISFDIGSVSRDLDDIPGAREHAIATRPIHKLVSRLDQALEQHKQRQVEMGEEHPPHIVVIGGGVAGIELAMSVTTRWQNSYPETSCTLLDAGSVLIPTESALAREKLKETLATRRIKVRHDVRVKDVFENCIQLEDSDTMIHFSLCIWATGAGANPLAYYLSSNRGLETTEHGWIKVQPSLQSTKYPYVFSVGDCASIQGLGQGSPPKAGVYAVRAGPILVENLISYLKGCALSVYEPQDDFWKLLVCGEETAIGFRFGIAIQGHWVWQLKNHIDRQFMQQFDVDNLPPPTEASLDMSQYDDVSDMLPTLQLNPAHDAELIQRNDDGVDFLQAWAVLRAMAKDSGYRDSVISNIKSR
ncbi:hypothetical protein MPSEU_000704400 [Mayamaea pseudoterrestris]|nr:hypothetical protein MPSEU_000704400 [Mayamaea pseudoterrestris]